MNVEQSPIEKLIHYARNPRKNDHAVDLVAAAIREFGFRVPIIAKSDGTVVDGHLRLKAAAKLGLADVPVVLADDLTDSQIKAFRISVNRMAELADWDDELLKLEIEDLKLDGFDLELTGFELPELDKMFGNEGSEGLTDPDDVPEVKPDPKSKLGDVWILGDHRVMCGDSTDAASVAILMNGQKADLLITDPPYGVSYADKNAFLNAISRGNHIQEKIENDHMTADQMNELWNIVLTNAHDACSDKASYYIFSPQGGDLMMMMSIKYAKWQLKHMLVWVKNNHVLGRCDYHYKHEPVFFGWKEGGTHEFYGGSSCFSVLEFNKPMKNDLHPTMKPIELCEYLVKNSSKNRDTVLDIFLGSGSTLIACEKTGRKCYGMELSPQYVDVIIKRWQDFTGKKAVREHDLVPFDDIASAG